MALTREEILRLIKEEENKILLAQERKASYELHVQANASLDEQKEEALANKPMEKPLGKLFYIIAISAGLLIIGLIVIIILGIISNWSFTF